MSFPSTGQTSYGAIVKAYIDGADTAAAASAVATAADAADAARWTTAPRVDDLTYPLIIAHRGAALLEAENSLAAYKKAAALGFQAIEAGDVQALSDGTLVCMHDSTVDRTTDGTGAVNTFTAATWAALNIDVEVAQSAGAFATQPEFTWNDALSALAGRCVVVPEVKDGLDATATAMCDRFDTLGMKDHTIVQSFTDSNLAIAAGRGYKTMRLSTAFSGFTLSTLKANGVWAVGVDYTDASWTAANVALWQSYGFRVFAYAIDHQTVYQSKVVGYGADGCFTNSGIDYLTGNTSKYRVTSTVFHRDGLWRQGMIGNGDNPSTSTYQGSLVGAAGNWRWKTSTSFGGGVPGQVCPVANAAGTYTVTVGAAVDTIPTDLSKGPGIYVCAPDDTLTGASDTWNSYLLRIRCSGTVQAWEIGSAGAATSLGTVTSSKVQNLTTTATLTQGTAYTSVSVSALTVALKVGHQFVLPTTGQIVTVNAAAIVGATSVTFQSFTPSATLASGAVLSQFVTLVAAVTATGITFSRGDETGVGSITTTDTAHRGGWINLSQNSASTGSVSYRQVVIT